MRTSRFYSPNHPTKIVDYVTELISLFYYENNLNETCNIFSYLHGNNITISGTVESKEHPTDQELILYVNDNLNEDYNIDLNLIKSSNIENYNKNLGTFIGYATIETKDYLPFEHYYAKQLVKKIYQEYNIPFMCQLTINGNDVKFSLEHNFNDHSLIENVIIDLYKSELNEFVGNTNFIHRGINYNRLYKSGEFVIYNQYGPRASYGDISYIGSSILSNTRRSILIARSMAISCLIENDLRYSLVEISYDGTEEPVQIGIKGNSTGIYIENGTFFIYGNPDEAQQVKNNLNLTKEVIVEQIRWGI